MDITKELDETVDLSAEYNGQTVKFQALKSSLTPNFMRDIDTIASYSKAIAGCVKDWDLTAHGEKWPLDEESVGRLPRTFLLTIINRIGESWSGDKKKSETSQSGGEAAANSAP